MQISEILARLEAENRYCLTEYEAARVLAAYNIPIVEGVLCQSANECVTAADQLGYPIVLKVVSPDILHKTDAGCVQIGIKNETELYAAWNKITLSAKDYKSDAAIHGLLVQKMAPPGIEIIIGVKNDEQFGPVIMFGLGGILVEVLEDVSLRLLPLTRQEVSAMIRETKAYKVLEGVRGKPPSDIDALLDVLVNISKFIEEFPREIAELDLNPFFVYNKGGIAVDALITLK